jgi:K+-sensing histidine kinase KdpD
MTSETNVLISTLQSGQRAAHETERLFAAARAILGSTSLEEIARNLTTHFNELVQADRTVIFLVDHEQRQITFRMVVANSSGDELEMTYEELDQGLSGQAFRTKQPILSVSAEDEPLTTRERRIRNGVGALIVVPLMAREQVIGTVTAVNRIDQPRFSQHDVDLLMALASQAGVVIDNVRLLAESQRRIRILESVSAINSITSAQLDENRLFDLLYHEALRLMDVPEEKASFFLARYDEDKQELNFDMHYEAGVHLPTINIKVDQGLTGWVIRHNRPLLLDDIVSRQTEYGFVAVFTDQELATGQYAKAYIAVPLRLGQRVIGVLSVQSTDVGVFSNEHLELLLLWAGQIAVALENVRLVKELKQHAVELQTRNEELDAFAHTVAHDIKNLVQASVASTTMLASRHHTLTEQQTNGFLQALVRSNQKMVTIIEELMLLAQVRQEQIRIEPLNMAHIVSEAQRRLATMIANAEAQIAAPSRWPDALGYGAWVEEVWTNYLSNAIKYGGEPPHIELGATTQADGMVRFWVRDNGSGIPDSQKENLFKPFVRLSESPVEGHGLGLSIVRRIVERLGGRVGVENCIGSGCLFYFTLPGSQVAAHNVIG